MNSSLFLQFIRSLYFQGNSDKKILKFNMRKQFWAEYKKKSNNSSHT